MSPFFKKNTAVTKREMVESVRKETLNNILAEGFKSKVARYKSNKGVSMRKKDNSMLIVVQLVPIALLTGYILSKMIM